MNLTPKQLRIVTFLHDYRIEHGVSPTMQEMANELGVSKVTVFEHVEALVRKGVLSRDRNRARSLAIVDEADLPEIVRDDAPAPTGADDVDLSFPLVGRIAAGYPIERAENVDELRLQDLFGPTTARRGETFALQVDGDSMRDEGIFDGDFVLVEKRDTARNGERVVALLPDGETTLKTFFKESDGRIRLQPANPEFDPIIVPDCRIQGVVIGVLRRY